MAQEKKFVIATETDYGIVKGSEYELVEIGNMGYYIIDASGELTYYYYKSLSVVSDTENSLN